MPISGETILITGASSGIGRALTKKLAQANKVIACGRNESALNSLALESQNIQPLIFDVSDSSKIPAATKKLVLLCSHLDRVVLNAGDCQYLDPENIEWGHFQRMMDVNFFGWINTLQLVMGLLEKAERPHIVGIGSQVIFAPFSQAEAYGASKAAASYFLKSLALDLRFRNVDVSLIHPGFIDTPLTKKNTFPMPFLMQDFEAAEKIIHAMEKRVFEYAFPKRLQLLLSVSRLFPRYWHNKMAYTAKTK